MTRLTQQAMVKSLSPKLVLSGSLLEYRADPTCGISLNCNLFVNLIEPIKRRLERLRDELAPGRAALSFGAREPYRLTGAEGATLSGRYPADDELQLLAAGLAEVPAALGRYDAVMIEEEIGRVEFARCSPLSVRSPIDLEIVSLFWSEEDEVTLELGLRVTSPLAREDAGWDEFCSRHKELWPSLQSPLARLSIRDEFVSVADEKGEAGGGKLKRTLDQRDLELLIRPTELHALLFPDLIGSVTVSDPDPETRRWLQARLPDAAPDPQLRDFSFALVEADPALRRLAAERVYVYAPYEAEFLAELAKAINDRDEVVRGRASAALDRHERITAWRRANQ